MKRTKVKNIVLILIGIIIGALVFSQLNQSTRAVAFSCQGNEQPVLETIENSDSNQTAPALNDLNKAFVEITKKVSPTVVTVFTEKVFKVRRTFDPFFFGSPFDDFFGDFFGQRSRPRRQPKEEEYRQRGMGSGVIISKDGYILTNNHVVADADTIQVRLIDKRTFPAKVIGTDPKTDIALIKVKAKNLQPIKLGNSDRLQVGEWVLAIGSPLSENLEHTVTAGIVSAKGRSNLGLADYEDFIQTDAAINPGNSGGALVNLNGELVGINAAIVSQSGGFQGIGFAVPINMAKQVMESILKHGKVIRGYLGVYIQDINETMAKALGLSEPKGALISDVQKGGPGDKAGLKHGDVIIGLNGKEVESSTQLRNSIASMAPGTRVQLKIIRDGKEKMITAKLGQLEAEKAAPQVKQRLEKLLGFNVASLNRQLAQKYNLDKSLSGVVITSVNSNKAYRAGLKEGDLIVAVNRKPVKNIQDFNSIVSKLGKGDTVLFRIVREDHSFFVAFTL